ncbi:MAG: hypothetical protein U0835_00605 [Isosphaeraceae bacterium]
MFSRKLFAIPATLAALTAGCAKQEEQGNGFFPVGQPRLGGPIAGPLGGPMRGAAMPGWDGVPPPDMPRGWVPSMGPTPMAPLAPAKLPDGLIYLDEPAEIEAPPPPGDWPTAPTAPRNYNPFPSTVPVPSKIFPRF